jgi:nitroreductase
MKPIPEFEYPIHDLLQKRWSPRSFSDTPITIEILMCLFEAARWAASGMNEQPWRFIYAIKKDKEKYEKLLSCLVDANKIWANTAPVLVITLIKKYFEKKNVKNEWAMYDLGLAMGNLTTQASSQNLFVHNMSGFSVETVKNIFNLPDDLQPITMLAIGYLGKADFLPDKLREREESLQKRKPLKDLFII